MIEVTQDEGPPAWRACGAILTFKYRTIAGVSVFGFGVVKLLDPDLGAGQLAAVVVSMMMTPSSGGSVRACAEMAEHGRGGGAGESRIWRVAPVARRLLTTRLLSL